MPFHKATLSPSWSVAICQKCFGCFHKGPKLDRGYHCRCGGDEFLEVTRESWPEESSAQKDELAANEKKWRAQFAQSDSLSEMHSLRARLQEQTEARMRAERDAAAQEAVADRLENQVAELEKSRATAWDSVDFYRSGMQALLKK